MSAVLTILGRILVFLFVAFLFVVYKWQMHNFHHAPAHPIGLRDYLRGLFRRDDKDSDY